MQSTTTHPTHTPVLIVGGSLVGLSAALFLAWRGVPVTLVEKHHGSAAHPRATGFTERTLEILRTVGVADRVPQVAPGTRLRRVRAEALTGAWHGETAWTPGEQAERTGTVSPCTGAAIAQDRLEPILRDAAISHGADLRLGVEMLAFEETEAGVIAHVRPRAGGDATLIRASYVIAADGADSPIRGALGIARQGVGHLRTLRSVLFRCPGADAWLAHGVQQFEIAQPGLNAFLTTYGDSRWVLMFDDDRERGAAELADAVRRALGCDLPFDILATGRWELAGRIADRYRQGRIFLAGDAAHQLPPTRGGFGANTGIDDAWNLAWKLQWVVSGRADARLLDSYDAERRPVGWLRHQQTFARPDYARWVDNALRGEPLYGSEALELGQLLRSDAVIGADAGLPPAAHPDEWAGQPGTRAPHLWLRDGTRTLSTLDLFGHGFVLLTADRHWAEAADLVGDTLPGALQTILVGADVELAAGESLTRRFGIGADGATLVRPDGIVAWRSPGMAVDPAAFLAAVLAQVAALAPRADE